ncbi:MAG TPA: sensor domain-containing diguanylate cyclase [Bacilli bacterium]|nr:sensor domain-containing diguanylate cyclase [Bacilli bacterium]
MRVGMLKPWALRTAGPIFEFVLIALGLLLLIQSPIAWTPEVGVVILLAVPLMAAAVIFPVTLPSMLVSLELVFTFYLVLSYDVATSLWINYASEMLGALILIKRTRKLVILLNPALKVVCLGAGFAAYALVENLMQAAGLTSGYVVAQLFTVGTVFFLVNHLILNVIIFSRTWHFSLNSCLDAVKWELFVYCAVFPLAFLGYLIEPYAGPYSLLILAVPVGVVTYLIRLFNHMVWANRINQTCMRLSTANDAQAIYQKTFELAKELTDSPKSILLQRGEDGRFSGFDCDGHPYQAISHALLEQAVSSQQNVAVTKANASDNIIPEWETRSLVLVPLVGKTEVFGIICLGKFSSYGYKHEHLTQLQFLAHQVSIILDRNHVYERLERAAITNPLTGLYNAQYFQEQLEQRFGQAKAMGEELSLIIFDIDHFKKYNDTYGHVVGDEVLRQVAAQAKQVTDSREDVLLARYGGEEFVAIGNMTVQEAEALAEEMRHRIAAHRYVYQEHTMKNITISAGVAHVELHDALTPQDLMEKADQALYWGGKEMGRNRVAVYGPEYDQRLFIDSLTGLRTPYYLKRKLPSLTEVEANFPMHFLLIDIRDMRKINSDYGFETGNQVLIDASYLLKNTMRADDLILRFMDDEFLVLIKGINRSEIGQICERIRLAFSSHLFPMVGSTVVCDVQCVTIEEADEVDALFDRLEASRRKTKREMKEAN